MITAKLTLSGRSAFAEAAKAAAGEKMRNRVDAIGRDAVERAEAFLRANYKVRPDERRNRATAGVPLHGSIRFKRTGTPTRIGTQGFPFAIELYSLAHPAKIHSLNSGSPPHAITARPGKYLKFPGVGIGDSVPSALRSGGIPTAFSPPGHRVARSRRHRLTKGQRGRAAGQATAARWTRAEAVDHPGIRPGYFLELSLERAVAVRLGKAVRMRRH